MKTAQDLYLEIIETYRGYVPRNQTREFYQSFQLRLAQLRDAESAIRSLCYRIEPGREDNWIGREQSIDNAKDQNRADQSTGSATIDHVISVLCPDLRKVQPVS